MEFLKVSLVNKTGLLNTADLASFVSEYINTYPLCVNKKKSLLKLLTIFDADIFKEFITYQAMKDAVFKYMERLTSEIIEESRNPGDKYHLGKLVLKGLREHPQAVCQIDGSTGVSETNGSVFCRSILMATCMKNFGIKRGDVIALMAPNHMDLCIPFYAALYLGAIINAIDRTLGPSELKAAFEIGKPKIIFCQSEKGPQIQNALNELNLDSRIVTFDKHVSFSYAEFLERYRGGEHGIDNFQVSEFDTTDTTAFIVATSGTVGLPKAAAITHKNIAVAGTYLWCKQTNFPTPTALVVICAPLQWLSALSSFLLNPIFTFTRLQTSAPMDQQHCYYLINKYRPTWTIISPTLLTTLVKKPDQQQCDFTIFECIIIGGAAVSEELINNVKQVAPAAEVINGYGMSELAGAVLMGDSTSPSGSCGKQLDCHQYRLVSWEDGKEILEPNVPGELWLRGPTVFKEYYNDPVATAETFTDDGWFRTGDLFYRDSACNYFYVERIKLMLKYKNNQVSPTELETLIRSHPDVVDVAVTSVPDPECGDLAVACVVRADSGLAAHKIKELVKDNLSESKQLHGGVVFLDTMPMTASTKVHRRKLKEMVLTLPRE